MQKSKGEKILAKSVLNTNSKIRLERLSFWLLVPFDSYKKSLKKSKG
jgi:hypothetical protein